MELSDKRPSNNYGKYLKGSSKKHEYMNLSIEMKTVRIKWQFEFIKNTITVIKNSIETLISRLDRANKIIGELKKLLVYLVWFVAL